MKTWIVSSLDEETIREEEAIQGRKLYEEIRYLGSFFNRAITYLSDQNFCQNVGHTGQEFQLEEQVASPTYLMYLSH